ncbi:MAG: hypothetical protein KDB00_02500 [Planctomycetales bacterium]|nr:hypothetical protein [Planctomycetales bacterium]
MKAQAGVLYGFDDVNDQLIRIDMSTGAGTAIGPTGFGLVRGLAFDNTGTLYGIGRDIRQFRSVEQLITIDTATGVGTAVGPLGNTLVGPVGGMDFDPGGTLYAASLGSPVAARGKRQHSARINRDAIDPTYG